MKTDDIVILLICTFGIMGLMCVYRIDSTKEHEKIIEKIEEYKPIQYDSTEYWKQRYFEMKDSCFEYRDLMNNNLDKDAKPLIEKANKKRRAKW